MATPDQIKQAVEYAKQNPTSDFAKNLRAKIESGDEQIISDMEGAGYKGIRKVAQTSQTSQAPSSTDAPPIATPPSQGSFIGNAAKGLGKSMLGAVGMIATKSGRDTIKGAASFLTTSEQGLAKNMAQIYGPQQSSPEQAAQNAKDTGRLINEAHKFPVGDPRRTALLKQAAQSAGINSDVAAQSAANLPSKGEVVGNVAGVGLDVLSAGTYSKAAMGAKSFALEKAVAPTLIKEAGQAIAKPFIKAIAPKVVEGAGVGYGYDVAQGLQGQRGEDRTGANAFIPGWGTALGAAIPVGLAGYGKVKQGLNQAKAVDELEQKYSEWMSGTTAGAKKVDKITAKTSALDRAGTEGATPMRTLAEGGVIPNREGTKFSTYDQAAQYRESITPLLDANKQALAEVGLSSAPIKLDDLEQRAIANARTPENINSGRFSNMEAQIKNRFDGLRASYPTGSVPLSVVDDIKSAHWNNVFGNKSLVEADRLAKDADYSIAKAMQKTIEETAQKAGHTEVAQLNRTIGDRLSASKFLEDLNGKTIKGGRLMKYVTTGIGATLGHTVPGKIIGALGGNLVGEAIISHNVASPLKRWILKGLEQKDPLAFTKTVEWLRGQNLDRETRLLLPEHSSATGFDASPTPILAGAPTTFEKPAQSINMTNSVPDQKLLTEGNPTTIGGPTVIPPAPTTYEAGSQLKSPTTQQTTPAMTRDNKIPITPTIPQNDQQVNTPSAVKGISKDLQPLAQEAKYPSILNFKNPKDIIPIRQDGKIVGGIDASINRGDPQRLDIHYVRIIPEAQGKGLGTQAVNQLFKDNPNINKLVGHATAESKSFWQKQGAEFSGSEGNIFTITRPTAIPKALESLAQEARKYKSAEEFVKANNKPITAWDIRPTIDFTGKSPVTRVFSEAEARASVEHLKELGFSPSVHIKEDVLPTKSQLTDIYNQATKGSKAKSLPTKITGGEARDLVLSAKKAIADNDFEGAKTIFDTLPNDNSWKKGMRSFFKSK